MGGHDEPVRPAVPAAFYIAALLWAGLLVAGAFAGGFSVPVSERLDSTVLQDCPVVFPEDAKRGSFGAYGTVSVPYGDGRSVMCQAVFDWSESGVPPLAGETYRARVSLSAFEESEAADRLKRGQVMRARLSSLSREHPGDPLDSLASFRRQAIGLFAHHGSEGSALVRALVLGDRSALAQGCLYDSMQIIGLAHLVAVSGAHLSIVAAMAGAVLKRLRVHRLAAVVAVCAGICCYVVLTGCSVSVVRAAVMACIGMVSVFARRRSSSLAALSVCACAMLALRPENAWSLSFQLSVLATLGVVVFTPLASVHFNRAPRFVPRGALDALAMTFAANLTVLPVAACVFGRIPVLGVLANIPATAFLALFLPPACAVVLAAAAVSSVFPPAGTAAASALSFIAQPFADACIAMSSVPGVSMPAPDEPMLFAVAGIVSIAGLWALWPTARMGELVGMLRSLPFARAGLAALAVCVAVFVGMRLLAPDRIVMLDVGQGDSILIQSQGRNVLVDTGERDADLLHALARCGVTRLDAVVVTHHDADHCGALAALRGTVRVGAVMSSSGSVDCPCDGCVRLRDSSLAACGRPLTGLCCGDSFSVGRFRMRVVWPCELSDEGGNADSVCLLAEHGSGTELFRILLVGDAESDQLGAIMEREGLADIDVYKVGHHGARAAITPEQALVLGPDVALVSVGEGNDYGHPAPSTLESLEAAGAQVFRTDLLGNVSCNFRNGRLEVEAMR